MRSHETSRTTKVCSEAFPRPSHDRTWHLLEDDKLVTRLAIETDTLLDPPIGTAEEGREVKLVITVELKPNDVTMFNLGFA